MEEILDQEIQRSTQIQRQRELDGAKGVLVRGILSIILIGLIGLIIALINISRAKVMIDNYKNNPGKYTESSYRLVISGRFLSYLSLGLLGSFILVLMIVMISN